MTAAARFQALWLVVSALLVSGVRAQPAREADPRSAFILGQVVDAATGRSIADAVVSLGGTRAGAARILTRPDGRFLFRGLPRGSFTITVAKPGYAEGAAGRRRPGGPSQALTLAPGERVGDLVVRMWRLGAIAGTLVDETGEPVVQAQVSVWRRTIVSGRPRAVAADTSVTDDRGMFRFGELEPGFYAVGAAAPHHIAPMSVRREISGLALQFRDFFYGLSRGIIVPPPPAERFSYYPPTFHAGTTDASQAMFVSLSSGEERLGVDLQAFPAPTVRLSGVLVAPQGSAGSLFVQLVAQDRAGFELDELAPSAGTDGTGRFVFPAVPPGRYTLRATSTALIGSIPLWASEPIEVGNSDIDRVSVTLLPGLTISGRVEFEGASQPPAGARLQQVPILIEAADGTRDPGSVPAWPDRFGEFTTGGLVGGAYVVRVTASPTGWMFKSATYNGRDVSASPLDLTSLDASGVVITFTDRWSGVNGTVWSRSNNPDADALVMLFATDPGMWHGYGTGSRRVRAVRTGKDGTYSFGSVAPGEYFVAAIPDDVAGDWQDPEFLEAMSRVATRVSVAEGDYRLQDLRARTLR